MTSYPSSKYSQIRSDSPDTHALAFSETQQSESASLLFSTSDSTLPNEHTLPNIQLTSESPTNTSFTQSTASRPPIPIQPRRQSSLSRPRSPGAPKTPRTANRVRFDLSPTVAPPILESEDAGIRSPASAKFVNGHGLGLAKEGGRNGYVEADGSSPGRLPARSPPVRSWVEEEDYMADEDQPLTAQREGLLNGAGPGGQRATLDVDELIGGERAKSGMRSAFMNMANSIM
jgi:hypothetical protein